MPVENDGDEEEAHHGRVRGEVAGAGAGRQAFGDGAGKVRHSQKLPGQQVSLRSVHIRRANTIWVLAHG